VSEPQYHRPESRAGDGSLPGRAEHRENRDGEQSLQACRKGTRAVPAVVVEALPSAAQVREDVLEVGRGARRSAKCRPVELSTRRAAGASFFPLAERWELTTRTGQLCLRSRFPEGGDTPAISSVVIPHEH
jgi:hypothetical protein